MSPFKVQAGRAICAGCGARVANTAAAKIEHLTTPSRARALQSRLTKRAAS